MYEDQDGFKYFLLLTDVFSSKIWCEPLKNKDTQTVRKAFQKIFDEIKFVPTEIQTDFGSEFKSQRDWLKQKHILLKIKTGTKNKANFAEFGIYMVKKRLFMLLRSKLSKFWSKYLPFIVNALNQRQLERLGNLRPEDISSPLDNVKVQNARKEKNIQVYKEPDWRTQEKNQSDYEASSNPLKVGTFVYADQLQSVFQKSFHFQVIKI